MPAKRLRNDNWKQSLQQVYERGGSIEISMHRPELNSREDNHNEHSIDHHHHNNNTITQETNLVWRVKIIEVKDTEIVVASPATLGKVIPFATGVTLVGALVIGQNRWMFSTKVLGHTKLSINPNHDMIALILDYPSQVERCRRRHFHRVATYTVNLPKISCWPLLDQESATIAEKANQIQIMNAHNAVSKNIDPVNEQMALPEVGPRFDASLANIGGGGIGLFIDQQNAMSLTRHRVFWLRIALPPEIPLPLAVTAKLVHTHIDSTQKTYAGMAFEFGHHKQHQDFIVDQLCRYVEVQQCKQLENQYKIAS